MKSYEENKLLGGASCKNHIFLNAFALCKNDLFFCEFEKMFTFVTPKKGVP
jgi:hypothetical protein